MYPSGMNLATEEQNLITKAPKYRSLFGSQIKEPRGGQWSGGS